MILLYDVETSGLPAKGNYDNPHHPQTPRLVELGALLYTDEGKLYGKLELIVKPDGFEIPKAASDVHGITTERALSEGVPLVEAMSRFDKMVDLCHTVVAHNLSYDYLIYRGECIKLGLEDKLKDKTHACTKELMTDVCKIPGNYGKYKWPTLQEAHVHLFNYEFSGAHGAMADIQACAKVFFKLKGIDI
jgi:DNA polymerase III epsilon subunit-like protein